MTDGDDRSNRFDAAPDDRDGEPFFDRLSPRLRAAAQARGWSIPTEIQRKAGPIVRGESDVLLLSPTGTGKTEAALLPLLDEALSSPVPTPPVRWLYVTPLRALNRDLEERLVSLVTEVGLSAGVRHGDTPPRERLAQSRRPPHLWITTPETLQLLLVGRKLREGLRNLRAVVVDEVHELIPSDRGAQLALTLERLDEWVGRPVRRIALSATVGNPADVARFLSPPPRTVRVAIADERRTYDLVARTPRPPTPAPSAELLSELKVDREYLAALATLAEEIRAHRATLIFVNTRPTAEGLAARLRRFAPDLPVAVHHGSLSRDVREEAEQAFRRGELRGLVATSSLELGIDIGFVDHVIQFGSPHQAGRFVQRIGRAGHRSGGVAHGTVLALDDDDLEEAAVLAARAARSDVEPVRWRNRNRLALGLQIVAALRTAGPIDPRTLPARWGRAAPAHDLSEAEWRELTDYLVQIGLARSVPEGLAAGRGTLERFYATLSMIPEERTYRLRDLATRRTIGTLDERFVLTQILAQPDGIFLLHGRTWRVVEHRADELLVETVGEIGQEPRWVGEDLPVPFEVAQEIGRRRRTGEYDDLPLGEDDRRRLLERRAAAGPPETLPTDQRITVTASGRLAFFGVCAGSRTNETLALAAAGLLTARLGARTEVVAVEPTWFVLELPIAADGPTLVDSLRLPAASLEPLLERLVPTGLDYRYVFLNVARKFGLLSAALDGRDLRRLEPLLEAARTTPLGAEALEKTLYDRYDLVHAEALLAAIGRGAIEVRVVPLSPLADGVRTRLSWRTATETPPPTLLRAVRERLADERLLLVCLRCGLQRETTPRRYTSQNDGRCRLCHGALSAVLAARQGDVAAQLSRYARAKWKATTASPGRSAAVPGRRRASRTERPRPPAPALAAAIRQAYTTADLLAHHGERALYALAARGVGPETARRLLARMYRTDEEFLAEIVRAERNYARTRSFWD